MTKAQLRAKYKTLRNQLSLEDVERLSLDIANHLLQLPIWEFAYYHLFLTISEKKEINTDFILHILQGKDKNIIVSKSDFSNGSMAHFLLTDTTAISKNTYGIPEPVDGIEVPVNKLDVVFVPLLAFDQEGHRVGYGKGFYDRFLAECKPEVLKIGVSFFDVENKIEDASETDIKLDYCVSPNKVFSFSS